MDVQLNPYLDARLQSLIWQLIDAEQHRSALFWSERYFCLDRENHTARHLYAFSLFQCGQTQSALHHVNEKRCHDCIEIYAKCCTALGRYAQASEALESIARGEGTAGRASQQRRDLTLPPAATLFCRAGASALLGRQPKQAITNFKEALKLFPYLWEAFEGLCALGSFSPLDELFTPGLHSKEHGSEGSTFIPFIAEPKNVPAHMTSGVGFFTPDVLQTANQTRRLGQKSQNIQINSELLGAAETSYFGNGVEISMIAHQNYSSRLGPNSGLVPNAGGGIPSSSRNLSSADESGPAPKKARSAVTAQQKVSQNDKGKQVNARGLPQKPSAKPARSDSATSATARRSTRLLGNGKEQSRLQKYSSRTRKGVPRSRTRSQASEDDDMVSVDSALSPSASPMLSPMSDDGETGPSSTAPQSDSAEWQAADECLLYLLKRHASALQKMAQYDCQEVVKEIESFSPDIQKTPWALGLLARAYYEMVDYPKAEGAFKEVRRLDPFRIWDMDLYSTLLWHLQKNVRLSFLAQELVSIDARSPQAWIAIGNCFSLQKERNKALSCFERASQLDPTCAYAFTLSGHESVDEDLEKAIEFFQKALRVDPRHYNAWYGLGTCYLRLNKLRQAEYHYRRATELHPTNAVLLGCLGMAVERRGLREEAFNLYKEAVRLAPDNALVRYRRAKILITLQRYEGALEDLLHLRDIAPDESNVVYQLAKLYRLMGNTVQSALQLATARDLSPQSMSKIKKLVETTKEGENEEEGDMEEG